MKYPDGSTVRVGDLIWWDEGFFVGYVRTIIETKAECEALGLESPHILISDTHPFNASPRACMGYPEECFEDEGVGPLTAEERSELERATQEARVKLGAPPEGLAFVVKTEVLDGEQTGWIFTFIKDGRELDAVKVPVRY